VGAVALLFSIRGTRASGGLPLTTKNILRPWTAIASPLLVAAIVTIGFVWLGAENLAGGIATRELPAEHSTAVHNLFFRH